MDEGLNAGMRVFLILRAILFNDVSVYVLYRVFFRKRNIFSGPPPIENQEQVIDWFFNNDKIVKNFRRVFPAIAEKLKCDILQDLNNNNNVESLEKFVRGAIKFWEETAAPQAVMRVNGPLEGETHQEQVEIIAMENYLSTKLRILGYFLLKKYGIQS